MSQEQLAIQANQISVRLVQCVPQLQAAGVQVPVGPGVAPQTMVLGVPFVASWAGLNGPRGFSQGQIELRLYEEGTWTLTFPNAEGEDGILHRRRFLIVSSGRMTPLGGNATQYAGGAFRPGDEFIEIYRGAPSRPGKLLMVAAVTKATISSGEIQLEGSDAFWLLKKQRETAAGFYFHGPRDVIEHYTRVMQPVLADDFPQDGRFRTSSFGSAQTTGDSVWDYTNAWNVSSATTAISAWSPALGSAVRLGAPGQAGILKAHSTRVSLAPSNDGRFDPLVRFETRFRWVAAAFGSTDQVFLGFLGGGGNTVMTIFPGANSSAGAAAGSVALQNAMGQQAKFQIPNFAASGWHTMAIEVRDRYILGYFDGKLMGVVPSGGMIEPSMGVLQQPTIQAGVGSAQLASTVDVDYVLLRVATPAMLRPADTTKLGDYHLGGAPAPGAASLEVWQTNDSPLPGMEFAPSRLSQFSGKTLASMLAFGPVQVNGTPAWWPPGAGLHYGTWSARASGSLYLTLGTYDYRFRLVCDDAGRLWVGKTRHGQQLVDNFSRAGHLMTPFVTPYLKGAGSNSGGTLAAGVSAGVSTITTSAAMSQPFGGTLAGQLIQIGNAAPYEYAYVLSVSGTTINLRDPLVRPHSAGEAVVNMNRQSLAGLPTGWYPFVMELWNGSGSGGGVLQYERSDQGGYWNNVGASAYLHTVVAMIAKYNLSSVAYWPLNEGYNGHGQSYTPNSPTGSLATITAGDATLIATSSNTLAPGDLAPLLNGGIASGRTGDYLNAGNITFSNGSQWTISALFRCDKLTSAWQTIFRKEFVFALRVNTTNQIDVAISNGVNWTGIVDAVSGVIQAGAWYHVVAVWSQPTLTLYVNGVQAAQATYGGALGTNANPAYIGATTGSSEWFNGSIGHLFFLDGQAMAVADVAALYQAATSAPHMPFSDSGIVDTTQQPLRYVSHYDQLIQTVKDWGLQITTEPMQLESGEFPGRLRPLVRVGRDTEYEIGSPQVRMPTASDIQDAITAEEVCDALVADAQGLADPTSSTQVSAEVFNFSQMFGVPAGSAGVPLHPWLSSEYDQSNDVSFPNLLAQRLMSQLALRGSPWEQVALAHKTERQNVDTFPLTGSPAEFSFGPGDGVRLRLPEVGVVDASSRQLLGVQWPVTPAGLGAPAVSFRQRPRNFGQVLRDMMRDQRTSQRAYQGQLVTYSGSPGALNWAGIPDSVSRLWVPVNAQSIVAVTFLVMHKADASQWTISVNGASTGQTFTTPGAYDVTPFFRQQQPGVANYAFAQPISGPGTPLMIFMLQVTVRV